MIGLVCLRHRYPVLFVKLLTVSVTTVGLECTKYVTHCFSFSPPGDLVLER